jgi:hypothetical protein
MMSAMPDATSDDQMPQPRLRVLYIGGWGRSGSTLLDRMLGQVPGFFSLGEVREIWQSGLRENRLCGCGASFRECPFWTRVGAEAFGGWDRLPLAEVLKLWRAYDRPWALPRLLRRHPTGGTSGGLRRYLSILERVYRTVGDVSEAKVLVDSSKLPSHALLVRMLPGVDLRLVHLIRDSRGVAFSWEKLVRDRATRSEPVYMENYGPVGASARWLLYNEATSLTRRVGIPYTLLRYEDLVAEPRRGLRQALAHAGWPLESADLSFVTDSEVFLAPNHTVDGNPIRFTEGGMAIRRDDEWRRKMSRSDRRWVTAITLPKLLRYGYPVVVRNGRPS